MIAGTTEQPGQIPKVTTVLETPSLPTLFPAAPWALTDPGFDPATHQLKETLFSLANGYLGTRGTFEEGVSGDIDSCEGTYLNGVYVSEKIRYGEQAYGYASHNQKMLQVANGKGIRCLLDGVPFTAVATSEHNRRTLEFTTATLERQQLLATPDGQQLLFQSRRLVSLAEQRLMSMAITLTPLNFSGELTVISTLDARVEVQAESDDPRAGEQAGKDSIRPLDRVHQRNCQVLLHDINASPFVVGAAMGHQGQCGEWRPITDEDQLQAVEARIAVQRQQAVGFTKHLAYGHRRDGDHQTLADELLAVLELAGNQGFANLLSQHTGIVESFWQGADITIGGDLPLQQGMRFNLLHLFMSAGKNGKSNISAKGLTGPGYDGHYFWDTEIYIIPFLIYTHPELARGLLSYRYGTLDGARNRARQMAHDNGALYPWRTIGGDECSAFFPAGTAQYHINAAIAYAVRSYYQATDDWSFICEQGAEILFETARLWPQLGRYSERHQGRFCLFEVTGPDEYTAMVDNNFYTNAMARLHLEFAADIAGEMQQRSPDRFRQLCESIGLGPEEVAGWQAIAEQMYLPYDEALGINPQHDGFLAKPAWDFDNTPADKYPLLLHYHPLVIYRHRVLKQADVVLAMFLLDDQFSAGLKARNLAYYEPLTTHDSTLSACIHGIQYAETGDCRRSYDFFNETVRMDLDNHHGNSGYGLHTACMAGSWMGIVQGFAGMRNRGGQLSFAPQLPAQWQDLSFHLSFRGRRLQITLTRAATRYHLVSGEPLTLLHNGQAIVLDPQQPTHSAPQGAH